jgi:hypothetical protein
MGLSAYRSVRLKGIGLIKFFEEDEETWRLMAEHAFRYTRQFVTEANEKVRPDDVIEVLEPALQVSKPLRLRLAKQTQQYWYGWFGELIVDRLWDKLVASAAAEEKQEQQEKKEGEEKDAKKAG